MAQRLVTDCDPHGGAHEADTYRFVLERLDADGNVAEVIVGGDQVADLCRAVAQEQFGRAVEVFRTFGRPRLGPPRKTASSPAASSPGGKKEPCRYGCGLSYTTTGARNDHERRKHGGMFVKIRGSKPEIDPANPRTYDSQVVRAWAREHNIPAGTRAKVPSSVVQQWVDAGCPQVGTLEEADTGD